MDPRGSVRLSIHREEVENSLLVSKSGNLVKIQGHAHLLPLNLKQLRGENPRKINVGLN